jgi:sodium/potassium-transporting ATPase subunit alpha
LQRNGVPFSSLALKFGNYPAALTDDLLYEAQSVYFFTLVVMQWGCVIFFLSFFAPRAQMICSNLLSTRTRKSSIFQQPPTWGVNPAVIPAAIGALLIGIFFCYVPVLYVFLSLSSFSRKLNCLLVSHHIFQTSNIPARHFVIPMAFALALIV